MNPDKMRGSKEGIREIQSPLGDGNPHSLNPSQVQRIREIQSPLGDGNSTFVPYKSCNLLEKYSPR